MKVFVVPIEPLETRYTGQWHKHFPQLLKSYDATAEVIVIDGIDVPSLPQPGAFLDFAATNMYKSSQIEKLSKFFQDGEVNSGDHIIFMDAWHPGIVQIKYMKDLLGIDVKLSGLWHAGNYDKQDFLGRLIEDNRWVNNLEKSLFHALDYNFFATDAHIQMFKDNVFGDTVSDELFEDEHISKFVRTGWPMEYMEDELAPYRDIPKEDIILFPHRIAPEKQVEIFRDLATSMPQYKFIVCQDTALTKHEYHTLLAKSKIVFSASLQETLGISSCCESTLLGALPFCPNRLSYSEIFGYADEAFLYPSVWTKNFDMYTQFKQYLVREIDLAMNEFDSYRSDMATYNEHVLPRYFSFELGLKTIFGK
jgi:glycosyltransferase involved in cell wall biosynthesis